MIEHNTVKPAPEALLESAKKVFGTDDLSVSTCGGKLPSARKLPSLRDIEAITLRARRSEEMLAHLKQSFNSECRSSLRQQSLNVRGPSPQRAAFETRKDGLTEVRQHADPIKEIIRASEGHTVTSSRLLPDPQAADEGTLRLLQVVKSLRNEVSSLSRALVESHPPGTFSMFFPPDSTIDAKGLLPPPPPVDQMLQDFDEIQRRRSAAKSQAASRKQIDDEIAFTSQQNRLRMLQKAENTQLEGHRVQPVGPWRRMESPNPAEVLGLAPPAPASVANQRAVLYLNELNAQLMLTYVMHAAAATHDPTPRQQTSASRGSSEETPSITPIASVADQSAVIPPFKKKSVVEVHQQSDFLGPSAISASTILHNTPHTSVLKGGPPAANAASKGPIVQAMKEPTHANESEESGSSGFSPRHNAQPSSVLHNQRSKKAKDNSSILPKDTSRALNNSTVNNDATSATVNTTIQLPHGRGNEGSSTTSTTQHDTSTAATKGMSSPSPVSSGKHTEGNESTSSGSNKKPASKVSWTDSHQGVDRGSSLSSGTTVGSTKSKKKPKKGLFSCFRREESDESDDEVPASDRGDSVHSLQNASE